MRYAVSGGNINDEGGGSDGGVPRVMAQWGTALSRATSKRAGQILTAVLVLKRQTGTAAMVILTAQLTLFAFGIYFRAVTAR